jgi:hypothetical protein
LYCCSNWKGMQVGLTVLINTEILFSFITLLVIFCSLKRGVIRMPHLFMHQPWRR